MSATGSDLGGESLAPPPARGPGSRQTPNRGSRFTKKRVALAAILLVGVANVTMIQSFSWNQTSHYDLTRALNQDRTAIDQYAAGPRHVPRHPRERGRGRYRSTSQIKSG